MARPTCRYVLASGQPCGAKVSYTLGDRRYMGEGRTYKSFCVVHEAIVADKNARRCECCTGLVPLASDLVDGQCPECVFKCAGGECLVAEEA